MKSASSESRPASPLGATLPLAGVDDPAMPHDSDDARLVSALLARRASALGVVHDRCSRVTYSLARAILGDVALAEKVVEEVFVSLWHAPEAALAHGTLRAHLCASVRARAHDRFPVLDEESLRRICTALDGSVPAGDCHVDDGLAGCASVGEALGALAPEGRCILALAYLGGCTGVEIAARLSLSAEEVHAQLATALCSLMAACTCQAVLQLES